MKELFLAIKERLLARLTADNITFIQLWNNQLELLQEKKEVVPGSYTDIYNFPLPAIFVEFENKLPIVQLGNGVQSYEVLIIRLHIIHEFYDAQDGTFEQDLPALALAQRVYQSIQDWMPTTVKAGVFTRVNESQDYDHNNLYHFIQEYQTDYLDFTMNRPIGGQGFGPIDQENIIIIDTPGT